MSAPENVDPAPQRTVGVVRKSRWPGWIWAVPLAAVAIVIWLIVREVSARGVKVTVTFEDAAQMKADTTQVLYRGIAIGKVSDVSLAKDGTKAIVRLNIDEAEKQYLNAGTRFYLEGAAPSLSDPTSLKAIVSGPTIQMMPGGGAAARSFIGIAGAAPQRLRIAIPYRAIFSGAAGEIKVGAPVTLRGFEVGEVTGVELGVDANSADIHTFVGIALDPLRFHLEGVVHPPTGDWTAVMNATLKVLVEHQLRARLSQSPPFIGSRQVELATVADAPAASLQTIKGLIEIPVAEDQGIEHLVKAAGQFPIREIGENVRVITEHIKTLSASPHLTAIIAHLDDALARLDQTLREAGPKVAPTLQSAHETIESLRHTANELDATVKEARAIIGTDPAAPDGSLQPTLQHVGEAARAVRELADFLDEHPESLIKGRLK